LLTPFQAFYQLAQKETVVSPDSRLSDFAFILSYIAEIKFITHLKNPSFIFTNLEDYLGTKCAGKKSLPTSIEKQKIMQKLFYLLLALVTITSCQKDTIDRDAMTTINFLLIADDLSDAVQFKYHDLDGPDGPLQGFVTDAVLSPNLGYSGAVSILNERTNPTTKVNDEIMANPNDFQVFFTLSDPNVKVEIMDEDDNGMPIGLTTRVTTGSQEGDYTMKIQVVKNGNKSNAGTAEEAGGEIAIEGDFKVYVRE